MRRVYLVASFISIVLLIAAALFSLQQRTYTANVATNLTKLNDTAKAELGRHSWYLFHTILSRFPDEPNEDERQSLQDYIHLFAKLYPCQECGHHFMNLLELYPPQTSSRKAAATWGCAIHNKVNADLNKQEYDCTKVLEDYDCGCATPNR